MRASVLSRQRYPGLQPARRIRWVSWHRHQCHGLADCRTCDQGKRTEVVADCGGESHTNLRDRRETPDHPLERGLRKADRIERGRSARSDGFLEGFLL